MHFRVTPELFTVTGNPNASNWNLEQGYSDIAGQKSFIESYPRRVVGTGYHNALSVKLRLNLDDLDYSCKSPVHGFKLILHSPAEIPQISKNYFTVTLFRSSIENINVMKKLNGFILHNRYRSIN